MTMTLTVDEVVALRHLLNHLRYTPGETLAEHQLVFFDYPWPDDVEVLSALRARLGPANG